MEDSFVKAATVKELPISKGMGGASMRLAPGVTRELHWHATAAEWGFVLEGRVRSTVVDPFGGSEIDDFNPGDVWYFPRGHPHSLACLGDRPCQFILMFDNGYFSEHGTFSVTDWLALAPKPLLAKNFGLPEATFEGFPKEEVYFVRGSAPPEEAIPIHGAPNSPPGAHKYRLLASSLTRPTNSAASGVSMSAAFRFLKPSPASFSSSTRADCANCTGTPMRTNGNTSSTASLKSPCSAPTAATGPRRLLRATWRTFRRATAIPSKISAATPADC